MPCKRVVVQGDVQGVGFRAFVVQTAAILGLDGEVWNRRDGAVEAIVCSPTEGALESFVSRLHHGPGSVDGIVAEETELTVQPGFIVGPTR